MVTLFLFLFFLEGCSPSYVAGPNGVDTNYTQCLLPKDQGLGSIRGKWGTLPIPLVFDRDFYVTDNGGAIPDLKGAISTWNAWSLLKGKQVFNLTNDGTGAAAGADIPALTDCATSSYPPAFTSAVGIWKISTYEPRNNNRAGCNGGSLLAPGIEGITDWIVTGGQITGASIILNFAQYNAPGLPTLDVQSLLLHELGHVLGMLHSCSLSSTDATTAPNCGVANGNYLNAVMYPTLASQQVRRALQFNDYARINCLY